MKFWKFILIAVILFPMLYSSVTSDEDSVIHRFKRKVLFRKNSKFFLRLNIKSNVIPWLQFYACAFGFRSNYDLPDAYNRRNYFFKRDIRDQMEELPEYLQKGYSCLLKEFCLVINQYKKPTTCGMFCGMASILLNSTGTDASYFQRLLDNCDHYKEKCPLSLTEELPFLL